MKIEQLSGIEKALYRVLSDEIEISKLTPILNENPIVKKIIKFYDSKATFKQWQKFLDKLSLEISINGVELSGPYEKQQEDQEEGKMVTMRFSYLVTILGDMLDVLKTTWPNLKMFERSLKDSSFDKKLEKSTKLMRDLTLSYYAAIFEELLTLAVPDEYTENVIRIQKSLTTKRNSLLPKTFHQKIVNLLDEFQDILDKCFSNLNDNETESDKQYFEMSPFITWALFNEAGLYFVVVANEALFDYYQKVRQIQMFDTDYLDERKERISELKHLNFESINQIDYTQLKN